MSSRYVIPLVITAGAVTAVVAAPIAAADPVLPTAGSENAADTISDMESQGYDVQVNWVNGYPRVSLDQCWVNGINTAASTGELHTAYIDIECPH